MRRIVLDLFAEPGDWSHALTVPGARGTGLEWDSWACTTRARVIQLTLQTDAARCPVWIFSGPIPGLTASPPCRARLMAGKRLGMVDQPLVLRLHSHVRRTGTLTSSMLMWPQPPVALSTTST